MAKREHAVDAHALGSFAAAVQAAATVAETTRLIVTFARHQVGANYAGITLASPGGRLVTIAPSAPIVRGIDQLQHDLDEGACHDIACDGGIVTSDSLATDQRWPRWGPRAAARGITSMMAAALTTRTGRPLGSVNTYWTHPRHLSRTDADCAALFVRHAAIALIGAVRVHSGQDVAVSDHDRTAQAQAILTSRYGLSADHALAALSFCARRHQITLRLIADYVITTRRLPELGAGEIRTLARSMRIAKQPPRRSVPRTVRGLAERADEPLRSSPNAACPGQRPTPADVIVSTD
jgi:hypothetical protein